MTKYFFETIEEIKSYVGNVTKAFNIEEIIPDLENASHLILRGNDGLGVEFFNEFLNKYNSGPNKLSDADKKILHYVRGVVANFAYLLYLPKSIITIGKDGATQAKGEGRDSARKWQVVELQKNYLRIGYDKLEALLLFMEKDAEGVNTWKNSDSYTCYKEGFINTVEEFTREYPKVNTRRTFMSIRHLQRMVEEYQVKGIIGDTLYTTLKTKIKANTALTTPEKASLKIIKSYVAWATMANALPELPFEINEKGIMLRSTAMTLENSELETPAGDALIKQWTATAADRAKFYMDELKKNVGQTISRAQNDNDITNHVYWV